MKPLDLGFNAAVIAIAGRLYPLGFDVSDTAPATIDELKYHLNAGNRMVVYRGGSDHTIYADREINWCFRAWHDWCHWRGGHDLTLTGEEAVCQMQTWHVRKLYGQTAAEKWGQVIRAEVIGQAEFYHEHGYFPKDQYAFVAAYLQRKG